MNNFYFSYGCSAAENLNFRITLDMGHVGGDVGRFGGFAGLYDIVEYHG